MSLSSQQIEHLVVSLLSVNGYTVERAVALMPAFRRAGLLDPAKVAAMDGDTLVATCIEAGYARGGYVPIIGYRIVRLVEAASAGKLDALPAHVKANREADFAAVLATVHGFGPRTAATAWALWSDA